MAKHPAQHIMDADAAIERRQQDRPKNPESQRQVMAIETIADELTMLRAEVKYLREALSSIATSLIHKI